jgi:3-phosphoshikimate 1-carboxyvinyltransferase
VTRRISSRVAQGSIGVPGSRSITNRALVSAALAVGVSHLRSAGACDDTEAMIAGLEAMGVGISRDGVDITVDGHGGPRSGGVVWAHASGTTARFLAAVAALAPGAVTIDGVSRLRERPIAPLVRALREIGATIEEDALPLVVAGPVAGGRVYVDASTSSQFVSALALIAPVIDGGLTIEWRDLASAPFVTSTVEVMSSFGVDCVLTQGRLVVPPGARYEATDIDIPPDAASAVYPALAAAITAGTVFIADLDRVPSQADLVVFDTLERMGCVVRWDTNGVSVQGPSRLSAVDARLAGAPDGAIAVAVAAAFAEGTSLLSGLGTLRGKESDRLDGLASSLSSLGVDARVHGDELMITGGRPVTAAIDSNGDHRMAMAFSVAGLAVDGGLSIRHTSCVAKTWPGFYKDMEAVVGNAWAPVAVAPRDYGSRTMEQLVIAIDGPGGSGKTTVSRALAASLGLAHLDTGAFYRAVTMLALREGIQGRDALGDLAHRMDLRYDDGRTWIGDEDVSEEIRSDAVNRFVSAVSADPDVRAAMVSRQREWVAGHGGRAVVEGRDIGTVVFPHATLKVFLNAAPHVRASRRAREMRVPAVDDIREDLARRDGLDASRAVSPLMPATDAVLVDTTDLTVDQVVDRILTLLDEPGR